MGGKFFIYLVSVPAFGFDFVCSCCFGVFLLITLKKKKDKDMFYGRGACFPFTRFWFPLWVSISSVLVVFCVWLCVSVFDYLAVMVWSLLLSRVSISCVRFRVFCCFCVCFRFLLAVYVCYLFLAYVSAFSLFVFVSICGCVFVLRFIFVVLVCFSTIRVYSVVVLADADRG